MSRLSWPIYDQSWKSLITLFLMGVNSLLLFNALITVGPIVHISFLPGRSWNYWMCILCTVALGFGTVLGGKMQRNESFQKTTYKVTIMTGISCALFVVAVTYSNNSRIGFFIAMLSCASICCFGSVYRSLYIGVLFSIHPEVVWIENVGFAFSGVFVVAVQMLVNLACSYFSGSKRSAVVALFAILYTWQLWALYFHNRIRILCDHCHHLTAVDDDVYNSKIRSGRLAVSRSAPVPSGYMPKNSSPIIPKYYSVYLCRPRSIVELSQTSIANAAAVAFVLFVTFLVYPCVCFSIPSPREWDAESYALHLNALFHLFDFASRICSRRVLYWKLLMLLNGMRFLLVPFFFICRDKPNHRFWGSATFQSLLMAVFGSSNGYLLQNAFVQGTSQVTHPHEKMLLGPWVTLWAQTGMIIGVLSTTACQQSIIASGLV